MRSQRIASSTAGSSKKHAKAIGRRLSRYWSQNIANIKARKLERIHVSLPVPEDHTRDYDRVIRMVEMHRGETLELDQEHFAQYVMDDWGWRTSLLDTAVFYGSATAKKVGASE